MRRAEVSARLRRAARAALRPLVHGDPGEWLSIAAEALSRYKLRTALSVLGVVLGVSAVIAMMSVSEGARRDALRQVQMLGLDNVVARNRVSAAQGDGRSAGLTAEEAEALRQLLPSVAWLSPLRERFALVAARGPGRPTRLLGVAPEYGRVLRLQTSRGRFLSLVDLRSRARSCLLGASLSRLLFGHRDPLGESVRIDGQWYGVVGVLADLAADPRATGPLSARDLNDAVLVPLSSFPGAGRSPEPVDEVWIQLQDGERVSDVGAVLQRTLSRLHRGADDVEVVIPRELLNQKYRTQRTFAVVVGSVAVLSLLVGGIGIMNIMLASVLERTQEIGLRRAVGATRRDVSAQFLTESLLMTLGGGAAGVVAGALASGVITHYAGWSTRVSPTAVALALLVSIAVGLTFGIYPARKAAQLQPIEALRYE